MSVRTLRARVCGLSATVGLGLVSGASAQVVFNVNSIADEIDDDTADGLCHTESGFCTLRAAVMQANKASGAGATIVLPAGTYVLTRPAADPFGDDNGDLDLTIPESGEPEIAIWGAGAAATIIDANQIDRIFTIHPSRIASISGVTMRNGFTESSGGAILNDGTLTVSFSQVRANHAGNNGGGIRNRGALTLVESTVSGNSAADDGGGIDNRGALDVRRSVISGNTAINDGGGIRNISDEAAYLANTTISGNSCNLNGGGVSNLSSSNAVWTYNVTIAFNEADADADEKGGSGGGIYNGSGALFYSRSSVIMGNTHSGSPDLDDCFGTLGLFGQNAVSVINGACSFVPQNADAAHVVRSVNGLGPLQFNGGSTRTHALLAGSGLIDGGESSADCLNTALVDQRGGARGAGTLCDLGAFEYGALPEGRIFADGFELGNLWAWG